MPDKNSNSLHYMICRLYMPAHPREQLCLHQHQPHTDTFQAYYASQSSHGSWQRRQDSIFVVSGLEKCIAQRDCVNAFHGRILHEIWINEEEHWHIDGLSRIQSLLLKAEALDLAEIWSNLGGCDTICCYADDISFALVRGGEESQSCLTWQDSYLSLLWCELPWQNI